MLVQVFDRSTLEDRIMALYQRAVSAGDPELEAILTELRLALREHIRFMREMTAATLTPEVIDPPAVGQSLRKRPE
jgi:tetrahydromethanopterin S-methyltransferase subunit H